MIVPSMPGGGYDLTARALAQAGREAGLGETEIVSLPGASGVVGLNRLALSDDSHTVLIMGLGLVGALETSPSEHRIDDVTPIARLVTEPEVVLVPAASPWRTLADAFAAWRAEPGLPVGGGSAGGGADGQIVARLAQAAGVPADRLRYRRFDGGGDLLPPLLTGEVRLAVSGVGEYLGQLRAGTVRALAVSGRSRVPGLDAPTLAEAGADVDIVNWRGVLAPPGIGADARRRLERWFDDVRGTDRWRALLAENGWSEAHLTGEEFARFLRDQRVGVAATPAPPPR